MNSKQFKETISKMPRLRHKVGEVFDEQKSEVAAWMIEQPGFKNWLVDRMRGTQYMKYDPQTGHWFGVPVREKRIIPKVEVDGVATREPGAGRPVEYDYRDMDGMWPVGIENASDVQEIRKIAQMNYSERISQATVRRMIKAACMAGALTMTTDGRKDWFYVEKPTPSPQASSELPPE
jgi:hypothetical protein